MPTIALWSVNIHPDTTDMISGTQRVMKFGSGDFEYLTIGLQ